MAVWTLPTVRPENLLVHLDVAKLPMNGERVVSDVTGIVQIEIGIEVAEKTKDETRTAIVVDAPEVAAKIAVIDVIVNGATEIAPGRIVTATRKMVNLDRRKESVIVNESRKSDGYLEKYFLMINSCYFLYS